MTRDWTEAQARAWLKASLPKGWAANAYSTYPNKLHRFHGVAQCGPVYISHWTKSPTLRSACRALIRAAKRAGIAVNQVQEPGGKS